MKKALTIGINEYKDAALKGCINDTTLYKNVLNTFGYSVDVLTNAMATKQNILEGIEAVLYGSSKGDSIVITFSGHGSQVPDCSGDESDGLDECLLPYDYTWDNVILDDDINNIVCKYKDAHVEILLDACHSGSGTRSVLVEATKTVYHARFVQPPMELFNNNNAPNKINTMIPKNVVTWSGCRDDQTSADVFIGGDNYGMFTFAFCNNIRNSRRCTVQAVQQYIYKRAFAQVPQLNCTFAQSGTKVFDPQSSLINSIREKLVGCS